MNMDGKKLRIGVIGCGGIARCAHVPAYLHMNDVEMTAFCDIKLDRAKAEAKKNGGGAVLEDYRDVLARDDVDVIDICLPNYLHAPVTCEALRAGKHVFCEKPDAIGMDGVRQMRKAAEESGKVLLVMRNNRLFPASVFAKQYADQGKLGQIYAGHCGWIRRRGIPGKGGWFTNIAQSGGGPLIDVGVHMLDLAVYLMGNPHAVSVTGATYNMFTDNCLADSDHAKFGEAKADGVFDVEDLALGFIRFDNGACLTVECSWASNIEQESCFVQLMGDKAGYLWKNAELVIYGEENNQLTDLKPRFPSVASVHEVALRHYVNVVLYDETPVYTIDQGENVMKIITSLYESAKRGREIFL